jgi:hypothetical protein
MLCHNRGFVGLLGRGDMNGGVVVRHRRDRRCCFDDSSQHLWGFDMLLRSHFVQLIQLCDEEMSSRRNLVFG